MIHDDTWWFQPISRSNSYVFFLRSQAQEEEDIEAEIRNLVLHVA